MALREGAQMRGEVNFAGCFAWGLGLRHARTVDTRPQIVNLDA